MENLSKHSWKELKPYLKASSPELFKVIEKISPPDSYSLYLGKYPYGALVLDNGIFRVFNEASDLVALNDSSIHKDIQNDLSYTGTIPLSLVVKNSIETFLTVGERAIPASFYGAGGIVSLWRVLESGRSYHEGPLWSMSSGARTICMLPKITDKVCYNELKRKYGLKIPVPRNLSSHWQLFKDITSHEEFSQPWSSELIFFSKDWLSHRNDPEWQDFFYFLLNKAWEDSGFKRSQFIFDFAFSLAQKNKNLKPNPYLADTVKHLVGVGVGGTGLRPATDNYGAPIQGLQKVFIEDYGLKKYTPTIVHSYNFSLGSSVPVYYSLEMPTTTTFSPRSSRVSSKMVDMRELKYILKMFLSEVSKENLAIEKTPLFDVANGVGYDFYHAGQDQYQEILNANDLESFDPGFKATLVDSGDRKFPEFSAFFNGCIAISTLSNPDK